MQRVCSTPKKHLQRVQPAQHHANPLKSRRSPARTLSGLKQRQPVRGGRRGKERPPLKASTPRDLPEQPRGASSSSLSSTGLNAHRLPAWEPGKNPKIIPVGSNLLLGWGQGLHFARRDWPPLAHACGILTLSSHRRGDEPRILKRGLRGPTGPFASIRDLGV